MDSLCKSLSHLGQLIETHASWVFLGEAYVFKFKKPVDFGFLDFTTPEKRKRACEAEVRLNARLAPRVYLGVVVVKEAEGIVYVDDEHASGARPSHEEGAVVRDYGVKMRRLADEERGDVLLGKGLLRIEHIDRVSRAVSDFHARCEGSAAISKWGEAKAVERNILENFEQMRDFIDEVLPAREATSIERAQREFLQQNADIFSARISLGAIRDGHGDLRLDHLYFEQDGVEIIDCIEFNDRFRFSDVCADVAFLVMDLRHRGRPDLAERLLAQYALDSRDFGLYSVVDFYESYRAYVRGKVTTFLAREKRGTQKEESLIESARAYFQHAESSLRAQEQSRRLICVGGKIASGKSTVGERLRRSVCPHLVDTDRTRKHLAGLKAEERSFEPAFEGKYSPTFTDRVYDEVAAAARTIIESGRSAIVEASFSRQAERTRFQELARSLGVEFFFIECQIEDEVAQQRLQRRAQSTSVSDGRAEIYEQFVHAYETPQAEEGYAFHRLDTGLSEEVQAQQVALFLNSVK